MFIKKANIKLYAAALFSAFIASSCLNLDETQDAGYGYLTITGIDVDINVSELVPTKSGSTVDIESVRNYVRPELSSATVKVTDSKGKEYDWEEGQQLTLPLGAYTVSATYGSNTFDAPCFVGTASGTISDAASSATVKFTLANSVMKVTNTIPEHYAPVADNPVKISLVNDATKNVSAPIGTYVFVPYGETLKVDVTGMSTAGVEKNFSYTMTSATEACKAYNVQIADGGASMHEVYLSDKQIAWGDMIVITNPATFKGISSANQSAVVYEAIPVPSEGTEADWSNPKKATDGVISGLESGTSYCVRARVGGVPSSPVTLKPTVTGLSASAAHTDTNGETEGGDLDGTDVQATFKSPHNKVTEAISEWSFKVCKSTDENTALRTFNFAEGIVSGTVNSDGSDLTGANDWPYLPQGDYTLIATATMENGTKVSSKTPIEVPAPSFTVTTRPVSSYTYYNDDKNVDAANNSGIGGSDIWIETKIGIADKLITKYGIGLTGNFSTNKGKSGSYTESSGLSSNIYICKNDNLKSLEWDEHKISYETKVTFDNVTFSNNRSDVPCHVTGLPYNIAFTSQNSQVSGWSYINISKYNKDYQFKYNESGGHLLYYAYTNDRGCNLFSPMYYVPEMLKVNYIATFSAGNTGLNSKSYTIYSGVTTEQNVKTDGPSTSISEKNGCLTYGFNSVSLQTQIPLSLSNRNRISISHNADLNWGQTEEHYIYIKEFIIQYAE